MPLFLNSRTYSKINALVTEVNTPATIWSNSAIQVKINIKSNSKINLSLSEKDLWLNFKTATFYIEVGDGFV